MKRGRKLGTVDTKPRKQRVDRRTNLLKQNQEVQRVKISTGNHLNRIIEALEKLGALERELAQKTRRGITREQQSAYNLRINALDRAMNGRFRLLNKTLPDLKALSFDDGDGKSPVADAFKTFAEAVAGSHVRDATGHTYEGELADPD